ncbi:MAG: TonB-dependent receptor [Bacteroidetes bacterium]|nr:TonB-dependent receptor [Bacteroidota bacterium]
MRKITYVFLAISLLCISISTIAQVTTSGMTGTVKSSSSEPLSRASIKATHLPSGTVYSTLTQTDGRFTISNMRVGGPYQLEISFVGYNDYEKKDIVLNLGEVLNLNIFLVSSSQTLQGVTVTAQKNNIINSNRSGASMQISQQQLQALPTINRNIDDYTRLVPQALATKNSSDGSTMGVSFAGASNRYNQFSIDGANATDVFGLAASGTNGGQAALNPVPFDAIDQVQIVLSPYDVTQSGFTGGGVNAVTRSGTNTFHGSIYGFTQNQNMVGKAPNDNSKYSNFKDNTFGVRLGGPIIKNKLFFFVNYERERRTSPIVNLPGSSTSLIQTNILDQLSAFLKDKSKHDSWSYDPGAYNGFDKTKQSDALFARLDWNIDRKNKLTIRHNYVKGSNFIFGNGTNSMSFYNNGYNFYSTSNSSVLELNSNFNNKFSNTLRATLTVTNDKRGTPGTLFPAVIINDNGASYNFGTEYSSQANSLDQTTFTLTDNFNIYAGKHTITVGTDNNFYNSKNVFLQGLVGAYSYSSLQSFYDDASGVATAYANNYRTVYSTDPKNPKPVANVKAAQLAFYAQDAFFIKDNFKLTYGIRADIPIFTGKPAINEAFNSSDIALANNVGTNKIPTTKILLSPRIGFNWDVYHNNTTQIRGGVGIFTGRVPFVWISNQYSNTGIGTISSNMNAASIITNNVHFSPVNPYQPATGSGPGINVTDPNFKFPRTLRANLALDQKLPLGIIGSIEGIYTKTLQDILYYDLNLAPSTSNMVLGNSERPFYGSKINSTYSNIYSLSNTQKGYSYNITVSLFRRVKGWTTSLAYSLGHAYSINDGTSSTAASQYRYVYGTQGSNNVQLSRSNYDLGSRIVGYVGKKFTYGKLFTSIGLVYTGQSGRTFSYVYYGDINGDDGSTTTKAYTSSGNDLVYLPTDASQFVDKTFSGNLMTAAQQFAAFQAYMNSDSYLKKNMGQNTARNGDRLPWENHFDLKLEQGLAFYKTHTLSVTLNIFNIGNLLVKNGGKSYYISNQEVQPLNLNNFVKQSDGTIKPYYYFNPAYGLDKYTGKPWTYSDFLSRWNMQLGLRYSF